MAMVHTLSTLDKATYTVCHLPNEMFVYGGSPETSHLLVSPWVLPPVLCLNEFDPLTTPSVREAGSSTSMCRARFYTTRTIAITTQRPHCSQPQIILAIEQSESRLFGMAVHMLDPRCKLQRPPSTHVNLTFALEAGNLGVTADYKGVDAFCQPTLYA